MTSRAHGRRQGGGANSGDTAREHYRREKARRARTARPESEAMAAARREYEALLAADAAKGKGGRPRKKAKPRPDEDAPDNAESDAEE